MKTWLIWLRLTINPLTVRVPVYANVDRHLGMTFQHFVDLSWNPKTIITTLLFFKWSFNVDAMEYLETEDEFEDEIHEDDIHDHSIDRIPPERSS